MVPYNDTNAKYLGWTPISHTYLLSSSLPSDTTIQVWTTDGSTAGTGLDGDVIHLGRKREAIRLGTEVGSTGEYEDSTRGYYNSHATEIAQGQFAYTDATNHFGRIVKLHVYDHDTENEQVRWTGLIDDIQTSDDGTRLEIQTTEIFNVIQSAKVNLKPTDLKQQAPWKGFNFHWKRTTANEWKLRSDQGLTTQPFSGSVFKEDQGFNAKTFRFGDHLAHLASNADGEHLEPFGDLLYWLGDEGPELEDDIELDNTNRPIIDIDEESIFECLYIDAEQVANPTDALDYPRHPLSIFLALLLSTTSKTTDAANYDVLNGNWGLSLPIELVDIDSFETMIAEQSGDTVSRLLLGYDGAPVSVYEMAVEKLLKPFGYYLGVSAEGKMTVGRIEYMDVADLVRINTNSPEPLPSMLKRSSTKRANQVVEAKAQIGGTEWQEAIETVVRTEEVDNDFRASVFSDPRTTEFDFSTQKKTDKLIVEQSLLRRVFIGRNDLPYFHFTAKDWNIANLTDYDMGKAVGITTPDIQQDWFIKNDGTRTKQTTNDMQFAGIVVGRNLNFHNMTYNLKILQTNYRIAREIKWRAPNARLDLDASGETNLPVFRNNLHDDSYDAVRFSVGDEIEIWKPFGTRRNTGEIRTVTARSADVIQIDQVFSQAKLGDIVRLASHDDYSNNSDSIISGLSNTDVTNVWFYLSDDNETVGSDDDNGNYYG